MTITGAGLCTIVASQPGDGATYLPAAPVSQTFSIAQETQTITVTGSWSTTNQTVGTNFQASATSSSGGQVFFTSDETNCTEVDNGDTPQDEFVPLHVGTCTIYAEQDGTTDVAEVVLPVTVNITGLGNQTGTFAVTSASRRVDQLQNTADDVTWSSGLTDSTYTTSGTVTVASVAASAALTVGGAATPVTITKATEASTTVTITVGSNPFSTGNSVVIAGITPSGYNGTFTVTKPSGSAGNTTFTYTDTSGLTTPASSVTGATATLASSGAVESGNTVTITTTAANTGKLTAGDTVSVVGVGLAGYNGNYTIATVPTTTTFTYTDPTSGLAPSGAGTVGDTSITGASESGSTVTLNLTAPPSASVGIGSSITVASVSPTTYNGTWSVTAVPTTHEPAVHRLHDGHSCGWGGICHPARNLLHGERSSRFEDTDGSSCRQLHGNRHPGRRRRLQPGEREQDLHDHRWDTVRYLEPCRWEHLGDLSDGCQCHDQLGPEPGHDHLDHDGGVHGRIHDHDRWDELGDGDSGHSRYLHIERIG